MLVFVFHFNWLLERQCYLLELFRQFSILFIGKSFCFPFYLLAFGTVPTIFHFIYWLLELFRQCWFLFSNLLAFGTVPTVLVFVFHFIYFWNCSDSCGFYFPFYLLAFGTVPTVLVFIFQFSFWNCSDMVFVFHFNWLLELFRQIFQIGFWNRQLWFLFSILFIAFRSDSVGFYFPFFLTFGTVPKCWFLFSILFIGFWNCSDSVGFCFPFYLLAFGNVPTVLVFIFHFIYQLLELFRSVGFCFPFYLLTFGTVPTVLVFVFHFIYWLLELFRQCWFLFSILFIGFWNCSDSCGFYFPIYWLLELFRQMVFKNHFIYTVGTVPTVLVFIFHFINCSENWLLELFRQKPIYWLSEQFRKANLLAFGTVPTVLVFIFHFIYWLLELFRQCWFLFSILFIGFWNCSDSVGFCFPFYLLLELFRQCWFLFSILFKLFRSVGFYFPFYLLAFGKQKPHCRNSSDKVFQYWLLKCSDSVGFCFPKTFGTVRQQFSLLELFRHGFYFPFYLLAFGTVPTVLVFVFHFIYWLLELFRQCWFLFSILFIGFWNCSDNHFIYWLLELSDSVGFCFPKANKCWFLFSILFKCSDKQKLFRQHCRNSSKSQ